MTKYFELTGVLMDFGLLVEYFKSIVVESVLCIAHSCSKFLNFKRATARFFANRILIIRSLGNLKKVKLVALLVRFEDLLLAEI